MPHYVIGTGRAKVEVFNKSVTAVARVAELGGAEKEIYCVGSQKDLKDIPSALLIELYNIAASEPESHAKPIQKFSDRAAAEKRVWPVIEYLAKPGQQPASLGGKEPKVKTKRQRAAGAENKRGRVSQFEGKKIFKLVDGNPRREGTHGYKSYALITSGMLYETFLEKGGRPKDLAWDVEHKFVEVKAG